MPRRCLSVMTDGHNESLWSSMSSEELSFWKEVKASASCCTISVPRLSFINVDGRRASLISWVMSRSGDGTEVCEGRSVGG